MAADFSGTTGIGAKCSRAETSDWALARADAFAADVDTRFAICVVFGLELTEPDIVPLLLDDAIFEIRGFGRGIVDVSFDGAIVLIVAVDVAVVVVNVAVVVKLFCVVGVGVGVGATLVPLDEDDRGGNSGGDVLDNAIFDSNSQMAAAKLRVGFGMTESIKS